MESPAAVTDLSSSAPAQPTVFVGDPTGQSDSAAALQNLIDRLSALGGGAITIPFGTYLMASYRPSTHPHKFTNLLVPSNVSLVGEPGTRLVQNDAGRGDVPGYVVENDLMAVGNRSTYQWIAFQAQQPWYDLQPVVENDPSVTMANPGDAANFAVGDWIGIYLEKPGDVIPSEFCQVVTSDPSTGQIGLSVHLARSFPTAYCNKIAGDTHNVTLRNLILEGTVPFAAQECFDVALENCDLLYQAPVGMNVVTSMICNTVRRFHMRGGSMGPATGVNYLPGTELPQRNSAEVTFENVEFRGANFGTAEFGIHWRIRDCTFWLNGNSTNAFVFQGWNMLADGNRFHATGYNSPGGSCITDHINIASQHWGLFGGIRFTGNAIYCDTLGSYNPAVKNSVPGTQVKNNTIRLNARTRGFEAHTAHFQFCGNFVTTSAVDWAILCESWGGSDGGIIAGNFIHGGGNSQAGIAFPGDYARPGGYIISGNHIEGFIQGVDKSTLSACHQGTIIADNIGD